MFPYKPASQGVYPYYPRWVMHISAYSFMIVKFFSCHTTKLNVQLCLYLIVTFQTYAFTFFHFSCHMRNFRLTYFCVDTQNISLTVNTFITGTQPLSVVPLIGLHVVQNRPCHTYYKSSLHLHFIQYTGSNQNEFGITGFWDSEYYWYVSRSGSDLFYGDDFQVSRTTHVQSCLRLFEY